MLDFTVQATGHFEESLKSLYTKCGEQRTILTGGEGSMSYAKLLNNLHLDLLWHVWASITYQKTAHPVACVSLNHVSGDSTSCGMCEPQSRIRRQHILCRAAVTKIHLATFCLCVPPIHEGTKSEISQIDQTCFVLISSRDCWNSSCRLVWASCARLTCSLTRSLMTRAGTLAPSCSTLVSWWRNSAQTHR